MTKIYDPSWLEAISEDLPCGANIEYDSDYVLLFANITPKSSVQYGEFSKEPEQPNWREVERDCRKLLKKSKDLALLTVLARCRTKLAGARGLQEVLEMIISGLETFPTTIYPQLYIDGEYDAEVRANALASLEDADGLINDIYDIVISSNTATRLSVRDVVRSFAYPPLADAIPVDAVRLQLAALNQENNQNYLALVECAKILQQLSAWCVLELKDDAPQFKKLASILNYFKNDADDDSDHHEDNLNDYDNYNTIDKNNENFNNTTNENNIETISDDHDNITQANQDNQANIIETSTATKSANRQAEKQIIKAKATDNLSIAQRRQNASKLINQARVWFEENEPSSPVSMLLLQAEKLVGKKYSEIIKIMPNELIENFNQSLGNENN